MLKLDAITRYGRKVDGEIQLQYYPASLQFASRQSNGLSRGLVQVDLYACGVGLHKERAQSRNDISCTIAVTNRPPRRCLRTIDVRRICSQHTKASAGVGDDARQRLVDLMRNRSCQGAKTGEPCYARKLRSCFAERFFREAAFCNVLNRAHIF